MPEAPLHDAPVPGRPGGGSWGSDLIAETLRALEVPYVAHVPGSSWRGLHDSIVNRLGNRAPQLILTLHEEAAVAIAHGYAKVSGRMMAAALHANVGLLRAPMAIYNAWCDRAPLLLLGATGPWDATRRRPTEWIHTSADQGGLVRDFTKWDNQPGSPGAAVEALLRASQIARTAPRGPVYVNLDVGVQEQPLEGPLTPPDAARFAAADAVHPAPETTARATALLAGARRPVILLGRCSREVADWDARVALAERLGAPVLTHVREAAAFPTDHPLHVAPPMLHWLAEPAARALRQADVVLALDWPDLAHVLAARDGHPAVAAQVIRVSCDQHSHRGWAGDHRALPPSDLYLLCETDAAVRALRAALGPGPVPQAPATAPPREPERPAPESPLTLGGVAAAVEAARGDQALCFTRFPMGWDGAGAHFRHPLDYVGYDGGSGVGSGPGITVGAGLALHGSGRVPVAILGDGDFVMGSAALWTAAHYRVGCLLIVCNNRSFHTDESHQRRVAEERERPTANRWIGARIDGPAVDVAQLARSLGAVGLGPVAAVSALSAAVAEGLRHAREGRACVIDAHVTMGAADAAPERGERQETGARGGFLARWLSRA